RSTSSDSGKLKVEVTINMRTVQGCFGFQFQAGSAKPVRLVAAGAPLRGGSTSSRAAHGVGAG
ncbi:MAG: hypothetical protein ABI379_09455, partial [Rhodanobacter sp.]